MPEHPIDDEDARLAALHEYDVLDTLPEEPFERIVRLVQKIIGVPMATVTFVDRDRQWFKAKQGLDFSETERCVSVCDHTIRRYDPMIVPDLRADPRFADFPCTTEEKPILAYLGIPLVNEDDFALGALCAMDHAPRQFTSEEVALLQEFAGLVVDWLEVRRMAQTDFLTGAMARRSFLKELDKQIGRHQRHGRPSALALFDIDHFKRVNDSWGHGAGDQVLRIVAGLCQETLREGDVLARIGGEEFAILLPETGRDGALRIIERLRSAIEAASIGDAGLKVTASFGIAPLAAGCGYHDEWMSEADGLLYEAKRQGRNRSVMRAAG